MSKYNSVLKLAADRQEKFSTKDFVKYAKEIGVETNHNAAAVFLLGEMRQGKLSREKGKGREYYYRPHPDIIPRKEEKPMAKKEKKPEVTVVESVPENRRRKFVPKQRQKLEDFGVTYAQVGKAILEYSEWLKERVAVLEMKKTSNQDLTNEIHRLRLTLKEKDRTITRLNDEVVRLNDEVTELKRRINAEHRVNSTFKLGELIHKK